MKKLFSVLLAALLALPMSAQVSRQGNKYLADGQLMKSKGFAAYMQQNAEANLAKQFKTDYVVAMTGWGLFGGGIGLTLAGFMTAGAMADNVATQGALQASAGSIAAALVGVTIVGVGAGVTTAGIVCLGVGYGRMHKAADTYIATTRQQPQAYLSIQASQNGLGLALNF